MSGFIPTRYDVVDTSLFQPQSFRSSRSERAERKHFSAQDFMDVDDGLLGGSLSSKSEFDTFDKKANASVKAISEVVGRASTSIPGAVPSELLVFSSKSIGKSLLSKLGWKEGQGIGPRRKISSVATTTPNTVDVTSIPTAAFDGEGDGASDRKLLNITFAAQPNAVLAEMPPVKDNLFGIGFENIYGLRQTGVGFEKMMARDVYRMDAVILGRKAAGVVPSSGSRQRHSSFISVEDDADNVYDDGDDITHFKSSSAGSRVENKRLIKEVYSDDDDPDDDVGNAKREMEYLRDQGTIDSPTGTPIRERYPSDGRFVISGFVVSTRGKETAQVFNPPPEPPVDFKGVHDFPGASAKSVVHRSTEQTTSAEQPPGSINSLVNTKPPASSDGVITSVSHRPMLSSAITSNPAFLGLSEAFRSRFTQATATTTVVDNMKSRAEAAGETTTTQQSQSFGKDQLDKAEETGTRKATRFSDNNSIFNSSTHLNANISLHPTSALTATTKTTVGGNTAQRIFSKLTRTTVVWTPNPLLCKRFNVPVPAALTREATNYNVGANSVNTRENQLYDANIGQYLYTGFPEPSGASKSASTGSRADVGMSVVAGIDDDDALPVTPPSRPPMALFKSIFEDSSDDNSSDDENSNDGSETALGIQEAGLKEVRAISDIASSQESTVSGGIATADMVTSYDIQNLFSSINQDMKINKGGNTIAAGREHTIPMVAAEGDDSAGHRIIFRRPTKKNKARPDEETSSASRNTSSIANVTAIAGDKGFGKANIGSNSNRMGRAAKKIRLSFHGDSEEDENLVDITKKPISASSSVTALPSGATSSSVTASNINATVSSTPRFEVIPVRFSSHSTRADLTVAAFSDSSPLPSPPGQGQCFTINELKKSNSRHDATERHIATKEQRRGEEQFTRALQQQPEITVTAPGRSDDPVPVLSSVTAVSSSLSAAAGVQSSAAAIPFSLSRAMGLLASSSQKQPHRARGVTSSSAASGDEQEDSNEEERSSSSDDGEEERIGGGEKRAKVLFRKSSGEKKSKKKKSKKDKGEKKMKKAHRDKAGDRNTT